MLQRQQRLAAQHGQLLQNLLGLDMLEWVEGGIICCLVCCNGICLKALEEVIKMKNGQLKWLNGSFPKFPLLIPPQTRRIHSWRRQSSTEALETENGNKSACLSLI
jgi:hypothetical protein